MKWHCNNRHCVFGNEVEIADVHDPRISLLTGIHSTYDSQSRNVAGRLKLAFIGTINNLNPYVDKGLLSPYINPSGGLGSWIYDPLMRFSEDELASYYGWLAEHVEVADDFSWVTYKLRENARWHDSRPVTMADVVWTFDVIKNGASISWRSNFRDVVRQRKERPGGRGHRRIEQGLTTHQGEDRRTIWPGLRQSLTLKEDLDRQK